MATPMKVMTIYENIKNVIDGVLPDDQQRDLLMLVAKMHNFNSPGSVDSPGSVASQSTGTGGGSSRSSRVHEVAEALEALPPMPQPQSIELESVSENSDVPVLVDKKGKSAKVGAWTGVTGKCLLCQNSVDVCWSSSAVVTCNLCPESALVV